MAEIATLIVGVGVDGELDRVELEAGVVGRGRILDVIEHEELGFRAEIDGVADAGALGVSLGLLGDAAGVAVVGLAGGRLEHIADQRQRRFGEERINHGGGRVRHQVHVGFVDRLPSGDRGAVEHLAFGEGVLLDHADVEGDVLPLAARIGKAEVGVLHIVVFDQFHDFFGGGHGMRTFRNGGLGAAGRPSRSCGNPRLRWRPVRTPPS
jgi:hypothetical protein